MTGDLDHAPGGGVASARPGPKRREADRRQDRQREQAPSLPRAQRHQFEQHERKVGRFGQGAQRQPERLPADLAQLRIEQSSQPQRGYHHGGGERGAVRADHRASVQGGRQHGDDDQRPGQGGHQSDGRGQRPGDGDEAGDPHQILRRQKVEIERAGNERGGGLRQIGDGRIALGAGIGNEDRGSGGIEGGRIVEIGAEHRPIAARFRLSPGALEIVEAGVQTRRQEDALAALPVTHCGNEVALCDAVSAQEMRGLVRAA
jgi:hypothetical protein